MASIPATLGPAPREAAPATRDAAPATREAAPAAQRDHPLFRQYPLDGEATISAGAVPTPYHVYDGHGLFIGGTADLAVARELLAGEQVTPVQTDDGRALMGVSIFDFTDASLGAHHELQFSLFVSRTRLLSFSTNRLTLLDLMLTRPGVQMLCHGLWNNTPKVVAYNRELVGLDARRSRSRIERGADAVRFLIADDRTGVPVLEGRIDRPWRSSLLANLALAARLGLRRMFRLARQPWIRVPVLNPVSEALPRNAVAETCTTAESSALRYFDAARDRLAFGATRYRRLQFQPQFVQYLDGFKFVCLNPS
jgi:hypothetical protein